MPEGPELHLTSFFVNKICSNRLFSGKIARNPIHKSLEVEWDEPEYNITAESRGKELMLHLFSRTGPQSGHRKSRSRSVSILFTFGMSGKFEFTLANELLKHSHLTFFTLGEPKMALSFVDYRRFGRWTEGAPWSADRGPCIIQDYEGFLKNTVSCLNSPAFNKPICELLLNQKFFSGIGNYLRAEILYRCKVPPFEKASSVFSLKKQEAVQKETRKPEVIVQMSKECMKCIKTEVQEDNCSDRKDSIDQVQMQDLSVRIKCSKLENRWEEGEVTFEDLSDRAKELLQLCHTVPLEVIQLGSQKSSLTEMYTDKGPQSFEQWLQCYCQPGMKNLADHNNRTIWFSGPPGPMVPKEQKSRGMKKSKSSSASEKQEKEEVLEIKVENGKSESLDKSKRRKKTANSTDSIDDISVKNTFRKANQRSGKEKIYGTTEDTHVEGKETLSLKRKGTKPTENQGQQMKVMKLKKEDVITYSSPQQRITRSSLRLRTK